MHHDAGGQAGRERKPMAPEEDIKDNDRGERSLCPAAFAAAAAIAAALTLIAYSNTLRSQFQFDDFIYIVDNYKLRNLSYFWPPSGTRYLGQLTFALNYRLGGLNVFGYHIVNTVIHVCNALLVYLLVYLTFNTPRMNGATLKNRSAVGAAAALTACALFAAHPVQTEAVTYITQRMASLAAFFYLASIVLYIRWRIRADLSVSPSYVLSLVLGALAQMTKEISFTLPAMIFLYEFTFFAAEQRPLRRITRLLPFAALMSIIPLMLFGGVSDGAGYETIEEIIRQAQLTDLYTISRHDYLITQFRVVVTYLRLLILPAGQNLDYDYPVFHSFFEPEVFSSFILLLFSIVGAVILYIRSLKKGGPFALLSAIGVFWFFITLSVESSVIPINDVIFEHRLYLPSVGAFLAFAAAAFYLYGRLTQAGYRVPLAVFTAALIAATAGPLCAASYSRNRLWRDELTLYADIIKKSPNKARAHDDLGKIYLKLGRIDDAIAEHEKALRLKPEFFDARNSLALAYTAKGEPAKALDEYEYMEKLRPDEPVAHNGAGYIYYLQGRHEDAEREYRKAIELKPNFSMAHNNLGLLYYEKGRTADAIAELEAAIRAKPDNSEAHFNIAQALVSEGRAAEAAKHYRMFIDLAPEKYLTQKETAAAYLKSLGK